MVRGTEIENMLTGSQKSLDVVAPIVNGSLDHIIANAGYISKWSQYDPIGTL